MKRPDSPSYLVARIGLAAGLTLLAGVLLTVSIAVSAEPVRAPVAPAPAAAGQSVLAPAVQAAQAAPAANPSRFPETSKVSAATAVQRAWQRARDVGVYRFNTDLAQIMYPARSLSNVGRGPDRSQTRIEGKIDQPARTLEFRMWQPGMTPGAGRAGGASGDSTSGSGAEARIEGDRAYVRPAGGAEWKEVQDFSASFAPDNDPLAFLGGIKDVREAPAEEWERRRPSVLGGDAEMGSGEQRFHVSRFTFQLDGPALAVYLRDRLERQLSERGDLPLNITLDAPDSFRQMTGSGELWVDARGLPLRLAMHLAFPEERNGSHLEADIRTDFSGFPAQLAAAPSFTDDPLAWASTVFSQSPINKAAETGGTGGALACGMGATVLLLACRRSRRLYAAVVVAVVFSMVVVPLMQSERALAFFERQAARAETLMSLGANGQAVDAEAIQRDEAAADSVAPDWDPHRDPLGQPDRTSPGAAPVTLSGSTGATSSQRATSEESLSGLPSNSPAQPEATPAPLAVTPTPTPEPDPCDEWGTTDTDNDGVNDRDECKYDLFFDDSDSDDDGLTDGQELNKLGTNGGEPDTDGDLINDIVEVQGFIYPEGGQRWYLNPNDADTNGDGLIDSADCPAFVDKTAPTVADIRAECDSDKDNVSNLFEFDNDNDGVPDRVDLSPDEWADVKGTRSGQVTDTTPFTSADPFTLTVQNLQQNWPVLVDLQMRPVTPTHLAYAMNVLDWPNGDVDGQIQHEADTNFQNSNNNALDNPDDDAGSHGDMRLVPLLEIVMTGGQIPLKLTAPAMTVTVGSSTALSSTVILKPATDPADTQLTLNLASGASLKVYAGTCGDLGQQIGTTYTGTSGSIENKTVVQLADNNHAVVAAGSGKQECAEIPDVVNGPYANRMVDASVLSPYGITVQDRVVGGAPSVLAYVPLNVATDDTGGGKSAFQSHMIYWIGGESAWLEPQQMRIIWLVQMLTDECADGAPTWEEYEPQYKEDHPDATDEEVQDAFNAAFDGYCAANRTLDEIVPVQTYGESWTLAGLSVREDHGLDVAVAYVNPALAEFDDDAMWTLSWGLGQQFVPQRDCETKETIWNDVDPVTTDDDPDSCLPDTLRDLTVFTNAPTTDHSVHAIGNSTIEQRADYTTTVPVNQRWKIEPIDGVFPLVVENFRYPNQDYLGYLSTTETPRILQLYNKYTAEVTPILLYAREERYRAAGLEAINPTAGHPGFTVDINTSDHKEETLTGLQWAPYRRNATTSEWEAYPSTEYWDAVGEELEAEFRELFDEESDESILGRVATARAYSFALINGVANSFRCSPVDLLCATAKGSSASDVNIIKAGFAVGTGLVSVAKNVFVDFVEQRAYIKAQDPARKATFESLGFAIQNEGSVWKTVFTASPRVKMAGGIVVAAAAVAIVATVVISLALGIDSEQAVAVVVRSISLAVATQATIHALARQWTKWQAAPDHPSFMDFQKSKMGLKWDMALKVGIVFTFISIALTWGSFVTQFFVADMQWGSMATDSAFAGALATTIVTVLLFVVLLALGPIGAVVNALIGLVNAVAALICSALPQDMQSGTAGQWLCGGITGFLSNLVKHMFYSGTVMVEMAPKKYKRLSLHHFDTQLVDEEAGVVTGNKMVYSVKLTNTLTLASMPISTFEMWWGYQFSDDTLMDSTFDYRWQTKQEPIHKDLSLGTMSGAWQDAHPKFYIAKPATSDGITLTKAGINAPVEGLYLTEGYAVPEQECWGIGLLGMGGCWIKAEKSTSHFDMGSDLIYDVLPPTLDGFYELSPKGDGYALAWGQQGSLTFPTLWDADGDGLSRTDDPNDREWDTDGDGLSDAFELNNGSDPTLLDTDDDGLTDLQEFRYGSDPASPDSDGDGLYDCQEVFHLVEVVGDEVVREACGQVVGAWSGGWTIVYGTNTGTPSITRITANPADIDMDQDGLTDRQEYVYGYNPGVWSIANVLSLKSELDELNQGVWEPTDGFVMPGQALHTSATLKNELDNRQMEGLLRTEDTPIFNPSSLRYQSFNLRPQAQASLTNDASVLNKPSGAYSITHVAGALISNLEVESDQALLWLRFDEPPGSTVYRDASGHPTGPHDGTCSGSGCVLDQAGGVTGGALKVDGTSDVEIPLNVSETAYALSLWFKTTCTSCGIFSVDKGLRGAGGHDRHLYLTGGFLCARVYSNETKCTATSLADGQWHHLVHTFGGAEGGQKVYVDGLSVISGTKASSDFTSQDGINIGFSNDALTDYFTGSIDDVRLFDKALTQVEVRELANLPVFHMNFDQTSTWTDVTSFEAPVTGYGATHDGLAVRGSGANFDGTSYLHVSGGTTTPQLDLGGGRFTLAAWIYPRTRGSSDLRDTFPQTIMGSKSGTSAAYPTLQRFGNKIVFGVGGDGAWKVYTSTDVLTPNQWNHVAVTLNKDEGMLRLYVNGDLKGDPQPFAVTSYAAAAGFDIGRSSTTGTMALKGWSQDSAKDEGAASDCQDIFDIGPAEMCMAMNQTEVWDFGTSCPTYCPSVGEGCPDLPEPVSFSDNLSLQLWEDDGGTHCGPVPTSQTGNGDDPCDLTPDGAKSLQFTSNDAGFEDKQINFTDCNAAGHFHLQYVHDSIPFYGYMDELQIFGQPLDADAVRQLYLDGATLLHLPLDEAPGASAFEDVSGARVPASCTSSACPTSGTPGRLDRSAQFQGSNQNAISLGHSAANELAKSFTVAAWIKPNIATGTETIVATSRKNGSNGWALRLNGSNLEFEPYGYGVTTATDMPLANGRWRHVAAVIDASYQVKLYLDGALWNSVGHSGTSGGAADTDDSLLVGAAQAVGAAGPSQFFDGQIDDLWVFSTPLSAARIAELYARAPVLHMLFDEGIGATQFADSAATGRTGSCTENAATHTCPLTGEGVRGQMGLAARFDGVDDSVLVDSFGSFNKATVSAWVYRTGATAARESIVSYKENSACGFLLDLNDDGTHTQHYPRFHVRVKTASGSSNWKFVTYEKTLPLNTWVHLAGTYDGSKIRLYQNGVLQAESSGTDHAGTMVNCTDKIGIGSRNALTGSTWHWFPGAIDEVQIYDHALMSSEISDLYNTQSAWAEGRQSFNITVDNDPPTADLLIDNETYLPDQPTWIGIVANDPTSAVDKVELGVKKESGQVTWSTAQRCTENMKQPAGAWCAQFTPSGADHQGVYTLSARATDQVGRTGASDTATIYVDDTEPHLALSQVSYQKLDALASGKKPQTWVVHLSGAAKDLPIRFDDPYIPGSGVPDDGVRVTLYDADGEPLGEGGQRAIIANDEWSLDYAIGEAEPDGCLAVDVVAQDRIARIAGLDPVQVERHTSLVSGNIVLRASAPVVMLDQQQAIAGGQIGPAVTSLGGETTHRPVPVEVDLTGSAGADKTRVRLTCQHGNEGSWYTIFDVQPGMLKADSQKVWNGEIHHWSECKAELTTTATPAGGVAGVVKVCGTQIAQWAGDFATSKTVEFVVHSDSCGNAGCPVESTPPVTGIEGADLAFTPVLPGSAFLNEVPDKDEILHLPFEDTPNTGDTLGLRDAAGMAADGYCVNGACAVAGQTGPSGNAFFFDGTDLMRVDQVAGQGTTDYLTIAAWIHPTGGSSHRGTYLARSGKWEVACLGDGTIRWAFNNTVPGYVWVNTGYKAPLNQWTHIAVVYDNGAIRTYANGVQQGSDYPGSGSISNASALYVGGWPASTPEYFTGSIDEVRLFTRALTGNQIKDLYRGSGPLLVLPFEKPWATHGELLPDASGWGHDGTLQTGATDAANKSVSGRVGSYALSFDGVDDAVDAGSQIALANTSFSIAFWAKRDAASRTDIVIGQGTSGNSRRLNIGFRSSNAFTCAFYGDDLDTVKYTDTNWHHWACTYDSTTKMRAIYRDGVQVAQGAAAGDFQGSGNLYVGWYPGTTVYFKGLADDVRVYPRPLQGPEVADLYHAGWQAVSLANTPDPGETVERTRWSATVPSGLEGTYQVEMRGRDAAGHAAVVSDPSLLWRGEADNLKPRVTLKLNTSTNEYTAAAEDYHLAETGFNSPCGAGVITTREYFRSPWYVGATGDRQKLYRLTAVCAKPSGTVIEQATACDSFNNCSTVGLSAAAQPAAGDLAAADPGLAAASAKPAPTGFEIRAPAVVTSSHYYEPRTIDLIGAAIAKRKPGADGHALASLQVAVGDAAGPAVLSEPAAERPYTVTWTFPWRLPSGSALPDGVSYTEAITATDLTGRTTAVTRTVAADVVLPAPVTLGLASNGAPVEPGAILRESPADLALTWGPSSDGSGLAPYQAAWRIEDATTTTLHTSLHDPSGAREAHVTAGEAQRVSAGLVSRDIYGNARGQEFGSVLVDGPLTPDYITPLPSPGLGGGAGGEVDTAWMDSGCSLIGADRRIARPGSSERWGAQRGYITWDHQALRLAWTGANWSDDGDLFIYLDTGPGGTDSTFTSYPVTATGTTVLLPPDLDADTLIWVQDRSTASLLRWDGGQWAPVDREGSPLLSDREFRFDAALNGGQTDLYLPFELLGLSADDPLGALAFASEEPAPDGSMRIWATLPLANPVNSERVNPRLALAPAGSTMALRHAGRWAALSDGICPNGTQGPPQAEQHNDAVLQVTIESDPPGATASGLSGGLFWVSNPADNLGASGVGSLFDLLRAAEPPLRDGQEIAYTVRYRNEGSHTLVDASLHLRAFGALQLAEDGIELGDIAPGGEGTATFHGTVVQGSPPRGFAAVLARLQAPTNGTDRPLEWLVAAHRVDRGAPETVGLNAPAVLVGPEAGWLGGTSHDESGVRRVEIEIVSSSGVASTLTCDVSDPAAGGWSCPWNATSANGGVRPVNDAEFTVRLRATDRFGHTSGWSAQQIIRVDALPPTVTLAAEGTGTYPGRVLRGNRLRLIGDTRDNTQVGTVTVCLDGEACETADMSAPGGVSSRWSKWVMAGGALDYVTKTLTIRAADRLGNARAQAQELQIVFDTVAPVLAATQIRAQVPLSSTEKVLNGTVGDGGPDAVVSVRVQPPNADVTRLAAARNGETWWFDLPAEAPGQYTLWVDAEDAAGNVSTAGPFTVDVICTEATLVATSLTAEPVAGAPMSLTLTAVISYTGPDPLPAGISVALSEGPTQIGVVTTTAPLETGESQALSLVWAPDSARDYDIAVNVGQDGILPYMPDGPLCVTPSAAHFTVPVRDTMLYLGWNLISPLVNPSNTDVQVVQQGITGTYTSILGYDRGLRVYRPDRPGENTLKAVDALHGYWIRAIIPPPVPVTYTLGEPVAGWRMAGEILLADQPLTLEAGWNLAGYLPRQPLTLTTALGPIEGQYGSVLGFEHTALSYYPDLDAGYNTLGYMAPGHGYWISATQAITLRYPLISITETLPVTATRAAWDRLYPVVKAESDAGVQPTYEWMNFYGMLALPDGTGAPAGTVVLAIDPQGVICGATATWEVGRYGLLACYRDDPDTSADEGGVPGDTIRLVVGEGSPPHPGSWVIGEGTWTAHGARQEAPAGPPPDLGRRTYLPLLLQEAAMPAEDVGPAPEPGAGS